MSAAARVTCHRCLPSCFRPGIRARIPSSSSAYPNRSASWPRFPTCRSMFGRLRRSARAPMCSLTCPAVTNGSMGRHSPLAFGPRSFGTSRGRKPSRSMKIVRNAYDGHRSKPVKGSATAAPSVRLASGRDHSSRRLCSSLEPGGTVVSMGPCPGSCLRRRPHLGPRHGYFTVLVR